MEIRVIKFADIVPDDYNPRKALTKDDVQFTRLKNSLTEIGYIEPIVFNEATGHIVGGHQRVTVMQYLGETEAEMSIVNLPEHEEKLLNLRLNKIKGRWDYTKLEEVLRGFTIEEAQLTGFGSDELAVMLAEQGGANPFAEDLGEDDFGDLGDEDDEDGEGHPGEGETGDEDEGDPEDDVPEDFDGASWVVTLKFQNAREARKWCEGHGHKGAVKEGAGTTVIRME